MEQWSILSNVVTYVQYNGQLKNLYDLDIRAVNQKKNIRKYMIKNRKARN